jgi:uncharacterized protein YkwD
MKRHAMFMLATMVAALLLASGVALAATIACASGVTCWGTAGDDVMIGSGGNDDMRGLDGNDTLTGGLATLDGLRGDTGIDILIGGKGIDSLNGVGGNDKLSGETGNDTYRFGNAWGQDKILSDSAGSDTLRFDAVGSALSIDLGAPETPAMELPNLEGSSTNKVSTPTGEVVIENAYGGSSSDAINGNAGPNTLDGNAGNDEITGSGGADKMLGRVGDDTIYATDGMGDVIDCGEDPDLQDVDTVYADQADSAINCERTIRDAAFNVTTCNGGPPIQLTAAEKRTLDLHNQERAANGFPRLCVHPALTNAARSHSQEMLDLDYFAHNSFNGETFGDRLMRFGYSYSKAGENLYWGSGNLASPESAFRWWMKSTEGHRQILLDNDYREVGIGVRMGTFRDEDGIEHSGTNMYTVDFAVPQ